MALFRELRRAVDLAWSDSMSDPSIGAGQDATIDLHMSSELAVTLNVGALVRRVFG
jgi:hypothetical protein